MNTKWRLADIVEYEIESTKSIIKTSSANRKEILQFRNDLCKREVLKGKTTPPFYYIMPQKQHDKSEFIDLVNLLMEHGVDVYKLSEDVNINNRLYNTGDIVVPLSQPFRPFIKEVMERQKFPLRHYTPNGKIIKPYDITSWSLPLHRGVRSIEINEMSNKIEPLLSQIKGGYSLENKMPDNYWGVLLSINNNESFKIAFSALIKRIGRKKN